MQKHRLIGKRVAATCLSRLIGGMVCGKPFFSARHVSHRNGAHRESQQPGIYGKAAEFLKTVVR